MSTPLRYDTVTFLSDYGRRDEFVGVVHSVIRSIAPEVAVVDLTHDIARHDVRAGGLAIARAARYLCPGVVLAVVDPGVGTARRPIAVEVGDGASVLVGPDNGLLAPAVAFVGGASAAVELVSLEHRLDAPGATFDGRDVFAPAAAHLCRGVPLAELGPALDPASLIPGMVPVSQWEGDDLVADALWIDAFGNVELNVGPDDLTALHDPVVVVAHDRRHVAHATTTYAEIAPGGLGLVIDSQGLVSLALDRASAAEALGLAEGDEVRLRRADDASPAGASSPVQIRRKDA